MTTLASDPSVRLPGSTDIATFLAGAGTLTLDDRRLLVDQALVLFEQNYAHLPLKVAMYAVNPVQRLRLLRARLEHQTATTMSPEWVFHSELSEIFHSVHDLHTNYLLPLPFSGKIAYLPFQVEEWHDDDRTHYVVSRLKPGYAPPGFTPGVEITHWNGIPMDRAVTVNGARFAGSNAAARHARGLDSMTIRSLRIHLPPDEEWVTVTFVDSAGKVQERRERWQVADNLPPFVGGLDQLSTTALSQGLDLDADEIGRAKVLLFAPAVVELSEVLAAGDVPDPTSRAAAAAGEIPSTMPTTFRATTVTTTSGEFGHVRIFSFNVTDPDAFVDELARLVDLLPERGLILDVRGNGGGHIFASELSLQLFTPHHITPEPTQFLISGLNLRVCRQHKANPTGQIDLGPWYGSMDQAVETGALHSAGFAITPERAANAKGQRYHGPVVLVTDARCYSATDIFAAGFKDHEIGKVLGVDDNTGAGGANVWTHGLLKTLLDVPAPDPQSPYRKLPGGADMRVSIRRTLRVGAQAGTPVEDLGIIPDDRHRMTRDDVLRGNVDLLEHAGRLLADMTIRRLDVELAATGTELTVKIDALGVERADIYVGSRPRATVDLPGGGGSATARVTSPAAGTPVRIDGFAADELVASRTVTV